VPTVTVGTDEFQALARLESKNRGLEGLPLALVKHPLGGIKEDEVRRKAETVVDDVARILCEAPSAGKV
jgi:hypothetical protein